MHCNHSTIAVKKSEAFLSWRVTDGKRNYVSEKGTLFRKVLKRVLLRNGAF